MAFRPTAAEAAPAPLAAEGQAPEMPTLNYDTNMAGWGPQLVKRRPEITMEMVRAHRPGPA